MLLNVIAIILLVLVSLALIYCLHAIVLIFTRIVLFVYLVLSVVLLIDLFCGIVTGAYALKFLALILLSLLIIIRILWSC